MPMLGPLLQQHPQVAKPPSENEENKPCVHQAGVIPEGDYFMGLKTWICLHSVRVASLKLWVPSPAPRKLGEMADFNVTA